MTNIALSTTCRNKLIAYWLFVSSNPMAFHRMYSHFLPFVCVSLYYIYVTVMA